MPDLDQDGIQDAQDNDIDGDNILNANDPQPRIPSSTAAPRPQGLASGSPTTTGVVTQTGIRLGFDLTTEGVPTSLPPVMIGPYVVSLANSKPNVYNKIRSSVEAATGRKFKDPTVLGSWMEGLATDLFVSSDPKAKKISLEQYLTSAARLVPAGTAKKPSISTFLSTREQTDAEINAEFQKMFGIAAPDDIKEDYFNRLTEAQRGAPQVTRRDASGAIIQSGGLGADVKQRIVNNMVAKGAGLERQGETGDFDVAVSQLRAEAMDYGVSLTDEQVRKYAINAFRSGAGVDAEKEKIKNIAKGLYAPIAPFIDQGLSVKDLVTPYINKKASILEIPADSIQVDNDEGQEIMSKIMTDGKLMPLYDYEKSLRADPRWRFTKNANEMASGLVLKVFRDFGIAG
jgi:hypothetical protein